MKRLFGEDSRGMTPTPLFQVTKGNKFSAKTAISRNLGVFDLMACRAFIYGLSEAVEPLFEVATLTGFEEATTINCKDPQILLASLTLNKEARDWRTYTP